LGELTDKWARTIAKQVLKWDLCTFKLGVSGEKNTVHAIRAEVKTVQG